MLHMVSLMCQKMARGMLLNWECHTENIQDIGLFVVA